MEAKIKTQEVRVQSGSVWQCGKSCMSERHLFKTGDRVEVVGKIKDHLGDTIIIKVRDKTVHIYESFFKKNFFIIKM